MIQMNWALERVSLQGKRIKLIPLEKGHHPELCEALLTQNSWFGPTWGIQTAQNLHDIILKQLEAFDRKLRNPFSVFDLETNQVCGISCYMGIQPTNHRLEIGFSWIGHRWQGTHVNPEMKLLMLRHAFETLKCLRVEFKVDSKNIRSKSAVLRLGARLEGLIRNDHVLPNGNSRSQELFSILPDEWPAIRDSLERRIDTPPK